MANLRGLLAALSVLTVVTTGSSALAQDSRSELAVRYASLPLQFEANQGQADPQVRFTSHGSGYSLFLTNTEAVLLLGKRGPASPGAQPSLQHAGVLRMQLAGARPDPAAFGTDELPGKANYFLGSDPAKWRTGVPTYARVRYSQIYDGIDLVYYGNQRQLEYDFVLSPGASADRIRIRFAEAQHLSIDRDGNLSISAGDSVVAFHRPIVYQEADGVRQPIQGRFTLRAGNSVGFALGPYDRARPLIIDPILEYATYLGGSTYDQAYAITVDSSGNAYVAGGTESTDFPVTGSAYETTKHAPANAVTGFISKLNSTGTALLYSTYLGGSTGTVVNALALGSSGDVYAAGSTVDSDFPVTSGALSSLGKPSNGFVTRLNASGSALLYSATFGGNGGEYAAGLAVDSAGNAYVTGPTASPDFPVTSGAYRQVRLTTGTDTVYVSKINPTGTAFVYSTYLGGSTDDKSTSIAVDSSFNAYITGTTRSLDFPVTSAAFQEVKSSANTDQTGGFVTKLNPAGSALVYSTYLSGSVLDQPMGIAVNGSGQAFITGLTASADFPVTSGALKTTKGSPTNAMIGFVTKLNGLGSALNYSTFLGGSATNIPFAIAIDNYGNAFIAGKTASDDFPITAGAIQATRSGVDAFVSKLNPTGSSLLYSTFLGGSQADYANAIAVGPSGRVFVAGGTESSDFPVTPGVLQTSNNASEVVTSFIARLDLSSATGAPMATTTTLTASSNPAVLGSTATFTATVTPANGVVVPGGSLTFTIDGKTASTQTLNNTGVAGYATNTLTAGQHTVSAGYAGNSSFAASSSTTLTEVINSSQAAAPVFSPAVGTYSSQQQVTITDSTPNAVICYTVNGTTPTTSSTRYTGAITVSTTTTIKAIATASGYSQSIVSSATYTIALTAAAPAFTPKAGTYGLSQWVTLATSTPNAAIYYTTDGTTPTAASTRYTKPIAVNATETIKAIATATGYAASPASSALYTLVGSPEALTGLATNITVSGATLNATVDNHNVSADVWFQWGTSSTALNSSTTKVSLGASPNAQPFGVSLTGLASKTTYYFRPVIGTMGGGAYGAIQSFTTQ